MKTGLSYKSELIESLIITLMTSLSFISANGINRGGPFLQTEDNQIYIVQEGDSLSKLADKFYSDPLAWPTIWVATNNRSEKDSSFSIIADPTLIPIGQKLWIPNADEVGKLLAISDETENKIVGIYIWQYGPESCMILRFYEDGLVLDVSVTTEDIVKSWPTINQWFNRDATDPNHSIGKYYSIGNHLSFSTTSKAGTQDYAGAYFGDKLILSIYSHINNRKSRGIEFKYLEINH